jgi:hypothetical protein
MIRVDKDVPLPPPSKASKYKWREMEIGDSFFVPGYTTRQFSSQIFLASKRTGRSFSIRAAEDKDATTGKVVQGVRVWRVK